MVWHGANNPGGPDEGAGQTTPRLVSLVAVMRILFAISVLSFLALVWATIAIVRHIRKNAGSAVPLAAAPGNAHASMQTLHSGSTVNGEPLMPNRAKPASYTSRQRHDRTYASKDSGNLLDPAARASTRPRRKGKRK